MHGQQARAPKGPQVFVKHGQPRTITPACSARGKACRRTAGKGPPPPVLEWAELKPERHDVMRTQPQSDSRPGSGGGGGGVGGGDFRTCDFPTALAGGRGGPEETLRGSVALPLLLPEPAVSLTEPAAG